MQRIPNSLYIYNESNDKIFKDDCVYRLNNNINNINNINNGEKITTRKYFPINVREKFNRCRVVISDLHNCYCITNVGLLIPNLCIRDLDKIDFELVIGGCCFEKVDNLLVFMMLNPKMKFENGSYYISLFHNIFNNDNPLFWIGLCNTSVCIYFNFEDSMNTKSINEYIVYVDYKTTDSLHTNHNIQLYENYKPPIIQRKIFQIQRDVGFGYNLGINNNIQKYKVNFRHPTHYFYLYWDDYLDHLKNITFYIDNIRLNCIDVSKLKTNNNNLFDDILLYQNTIKQNLILLPKCIVDCILVPYLYNSSETINMNKIIYVIKIDPNFDPNNYDFKTHAINLSNFDSLIVCLETDQIVVNTTFHIGCLSSNVIQQFSSGTTSLYFSD